MQPAITLAVSTLFAFLLTGCGSVAENSGAVDCVCAVSDTTASPMLQTMRGGLLGTRFESLDALKSVVQIEYEAKVGPSDSVPANYLVRLRHCSSGKAVVSVLETGTTQGDILKAKQGTWGNRLGILAKCPYAVAHRKELGKANALSRWRPQWFGEGDLAFFDVSKAMVAHINTPERAFLHPKDSTEKGYLNSFNHMASQAFITTCFSEELADFIGDAHERDQHPELITGQFTEKQLQDLAEGPVDNYVDMINNEWGRALGKRIKARYSITPETVWTPELLANYLNELQAYFAWAFQIGFEPFRPNDEVVRKFSKKMDAVLRGNQRSYE